MIIRIFPKWWPWLAMAVWPFIFVKLGRTLSERTLHHERIHHAQQKEMLLVFFYLWYFVEWIIRLFQHGFRWMEAYKAISFEREAFALEDEPEYLKHRPRWSWWRYL